MKSKSLLSIVIGLVTMGVGLVIYFLFNRKKNNSNSLVNTTASTGTDTTSVVYGGGGGLSYSNFTIKNAWLDGANYVNYINVDDAYERNLSDSGYTNRDSQLYATAMANGNIAYTNSSATTKYPAGTYYYPTHNLSLVIDSNGVMSFVFDEAKPTNLTSHRINIAST